jgi:triosephosphate isomerase
MKTHVRNRFIVGNWKMHTASFEAKVLAKGIVDGIRLVDRVTVILCPPFPYLALVGDILKGSGIELGAQNMYPDEEGAFTGEVSPTMLLDLGCKYVILGHSERRHTLNESDAFINQKVVWALASGLDVILCVGETLEQRQAKQTEVVLDRQLSTGLAGVPLQTLSRLSIAYEPVWAIGSLEHHATPQQAQHAQLLIRAKLTEIVGEEWAEMLPVHYGGSVEPENAASFLSEPGIDGVLIGGASLKSEAFLAIVEVAVTVAEGELQAR